MHGLQCGMLLFASGTAACHIKLSWGLLSCVVRSLPATIGPHPCRFEVLVDNPRYVHHMIVYACHKTPKARDLYSCESMDSECA